MASNKYCGYCEVGKGYSQYYKSPMDKNRYLPICKLCCAKKIKQYSEIIGNEMAAFCT